MCCLDTTQLAWAITDHLSIIDKIVDTCEFAAQRMCGISTNQCDMDSVQQGLQLLVFLKAFAAFPDQ